MELSPAYIRGLETVRRCMLPDGTHYYVRTLSARDLKQLAALGDLPGGQAMMITCRMLLCDEDGKPPQMNGEDMSMWPVWIIKAVVEEGMKFNRMGEELEEMEKNFEAVPLTHSPTNSPQG